MSQTAIAASNDMEAGDAALRSAIVAALMPPAPSPDGDNSAGGGSGGGGIPILPVIEIIVRYTLPFRCVVTTVRAGAKLNGSTCVVAYRYRPPTATSENETAATMSYLLSDDRCFKRVFESDGTTHDVQPARLV